MAIYRAKSIEAGLESITQSITNDENKKSCSERIRIFVSNITVEPVFAMYLLPSTMAGLAVQNLTIDKACRINLALNESICDGISSRNTSLYNETDEIHVQKLVAGIYAWKTVITSLAPSILLLFLGSWSDREQRRKPCIILPMVGEALATLGLLLCTYFYYELSAEYNSLAEVLPPSLTGGWFAMHMAVFSYISGISSVETRTVRIGAISSFSYFTYTVGIALSGIVFLQVGFYGVFTIALIMEIAGIIYAYLIVKDIPKNETNIITTTKKNFFKNFFDLTHVLETFTIVFKKGKRNRSKRICIIMLLVMIICGPQYGEYTVLYLYTRYKFHWDEFDFSIFCTYSAVVITTATILSLSFFSKYLKWDDSLIGIASGSSKILSSLVYAFAPTTTIFYLGSLVECLNGTSYIAVKSLISKLVEPEEIGKVYSLFGVCEALMPLAYGPMYTLLYKSTITTLPGAFFLLGGIISFPSIIMFWWLYTEHKKDMKEAEAEAEATVPLNAITSKIKNNST